MNVAINNNILIFLFKENISIRDSSKKEDVRCLPSQQYFDNPALRKDIRVIPAIS